MQLSHVWHCVALPAKLRLIYNRFALSHVATAYFALTFMHCIVQITLQVRGYTLDCTQSTTLLNVINVGNVTEKFAILESYDSIVLCHAIPSETSDSQPCRRFPGPDLSPANVSIISERMQESIETTKRTLAEKDVHHHTRLTSDLRTPQPVVDASRLPTLSPGVVEVDSTCSQVLAWPAQIVSQAKRESIAMIAFQIWLFGISIVAILAESIPHVVAAFVTHILSTAWAAFQIARFQYMERRYQDLVVDLACHRVDFMPTYWRDTQTNQIPILIVNIASLFVSGYLSRKLFKQFGAQTFTRVGVSRQINHLYLLVLVLSVNLQLTMFFLVASIVLWIDQLFNGPIKTLAEHQSLYLGGFIATVSVIQPWLYMGWTAVRREQRRKMAVFFLTSLFLIVAQTGIFFSPVYRVTFSTWPLFGTLTVVAYLLLIMTFLVAIVCRYFFGRGLAHFLQVQEVLEECNFTPVYIERGSCVSIRKETKDREREAGNEVEILPWDVEGKGVVKKLSLQSLRKSRDTAELPPTPIHSPPVAMLSTPGSQVAFHVSNSQGTLRSQVVHHEDPDDALRHQQHERDDATSPSSAGNEHTSLPPGLQFNTNNMIFLHRGGVNTETFPLSSPPSPLPGYTHSLPLVTSTGLPSYITPMQLSTVQYPPKLAIIIPGTRRASH